MTNLVAFRVADETTRADVIALGITQGWAPTWDYARSFVGPRTFEWSTPAGRVVFTEDPVLGFRCIHADASLRTLFEPLAPAAANARDDDGLTLVESLRTHLVYGTELTPEIEAAFARIFRHEGWFVRWGGVVLLEALTPEAAKTVAAKALPHERDAELHAILGRVVEYG